MIATWNPRDPDSPAFFCRTLPHLHTQAGISRVQDRTGSFTSASPGLLNEHLSDPVGCYNIVRGTLLSLLILRERAIEVVTSLPLLSKIGTSLAS